MHCLLRLSNINTCKLDEFLFGSHWTHDRSEQTFSAICTRVYLFARVSESMTCIHMDMIYVFKS